jgi:hypothetical protein
MAAGTYQPGEEESQASKNRKQRGRENKMQEG